MCERVGALEAALEAAKTEAASLRERLERLERRDSRAARRGTGLGRHKAPDSRQPRLLDAARVRGRKKARRRRAEACRAWWLMNAWAREVFPRHLPACAHPPELPDCSGPKRERSRKWNLKNRLIREHLDACLPDWRRLAPVADPRPATGRTRHAERTRTTHPAANRARSRAIRSPGPPCTPRMRLRAVHVNASGGSAAAAREQQQQHAPENPDCIWNRDDVRRMAELRGLKPDDLTAQRLLFEASYQPGSPYTARRVLGWLGRAHPLEPITANERGQTYGRRSERAHPGPGDPLPEWARQFERFARA